MLKAEVGNLKKILTMVAKAVFQLYTNLLIKEVHQPWNVIIKEQMESLPYTDIFGVKKRKSSGKTSESSVMLLT